MGLAVALISCGIGITACVLGGAYAYERLRAEYSHAGLTGKEARIIEWHGQKGSVHAAGRVWPAYSEDPVALSPGAKVLIRRMQGRTAKIIPIEADVEPGNSTH